MKRVYEGLAILLKYDPKGDCSAEHDVFYAGRCKPEKLTAEDLARLEELRWRWDDDIESWRTFV